MALAMTPLEKLSPGLCNVIAKPNHQYLACCPAHEDQHPSLSIREIEDGLLLIHCWAGCSAAEIVASAGLELSDLFPQLDHKKPIQPRWNLRDLIEIQNREAWLLVVAMDQLFSGRELNEADRGRCGEAMRIVENIKEVVIA